MKDPLIEALKELSATLLPVAEAARAWVDQRAAEQGLVDVRGRIDAAWAKANETGDRDRSRVLTEVVGRLTKLLDPKGTLERAAVEKVAERLVPKVNLRWRGSYVTEEDITPYDAATAKRIAMEDMEIGGWKGFDLGKRLTPAFEAMVSRLANTCLPAGRPRT